MEQSGLVIGHTIKRKKDGKLHSLSQVSAVMSELNYDCAQIEVTRKANHFYPDRFDPPDADNAKRMLQSNSAQLFIHCPHGLNLAREQDDRSLAINKGCTQRIINIVRSIDSSCVLHMGNTIHGSIGDLSRNVNALDLTQASRPPLLLENSAGQGRSIGYTMDQLRKTFEGVDRSTNVGVCIDTQHSFAAGICDFSTAESVVKLFETVESFTPSGVNLIHLNDSKVEFGKRVDRHAPIGRGHIWHQETTSLLQLCVLCHEKSIPIVLETGTPSDVKVVRDFYSKYSPMS